MEDALYWQCSLLTPHLLAIFLFSRHTNRWRGERMENCLPMSLPCSLRNYPIKASGRGHASPRVTTALHSAAGPHHEGDVAHIAHSIAQMVPRTVSRTVSALVEGWSIGLRSQRLQVRILSGIFFRSRPKCRSAGTFRRARLDVLGLYATRQVAVFDANCALSMQKADSLMAPLATPRAAGEHHGEHPHWRYVVATNHQQISPLPQPALAAPRLVNVRFRWAGRMVTYLPTRSPTCRGPTPAKGDVCVHHRRPGERNRRPLTCRTSGTRSAPRSGARRCVSRN